VEITYFDSFEGPNIFDFLSNFYVGEPIPFDGHRYRTGEHLFQALKVTDRNTRKFIRDAKTPGESKHIGRTIILRHDWEMVKYDAMRLVLNLKFTHQREEGSFLLSTGDALLTEGNDWNDTTWGAVRYEGRERALWAGRNWLGHLLMARRAELSAVQYGDVEDVRSADLTHWVQRKHV
jgi:ribA/ribD-fused uncharacterized protein